MKIETVKNPVWADVENTRINLVLKIESIPDEIPFTASPDDSESHGRALYADAVAGRFGPVSPYVPADVVVTVPKSVTPRQARLALLQAGLLDAAESAIAAMDGDIGRAARIDWEFASEFRRDNPLLVGVQCALGISDEQVDSLFIAASTI